MAKRPFVLRVQSKEGRSMLNTLTQDSTLTDLQQSLVPLTGLPSERQKILCGYPPKEISSYDGRASLKDVAINSGDTVTVVALSEPRVPAVKNEQARERVGPDLVIVDDESSTHVKHKREGKLTRKVVPADNSCLFRSVCLLFGSCAGSPMELRELTAGIILSQPNRYNTALLGRSTEDYASWITQDQSWGGAIEVMIFSEHFGAELDVVDIQTQRIDRFGEDNHYSHRGLLLYDGIHYDPLLLTSNGAVTLTTFPVNDDQILAEALQIAKDAHKARQFTDLTNFKLRCMVCGTPLKGQTEAQGHASATGHINFGEV